MARAASSAVRVPSGNSRTSISRPAARAASTTRWEEGGRAARPGLIEGRVAEGSWFGGLPMSGLLLGLHAVDGAEFRQAYLFADVLEDDLDRHVAADGVRVGVNADEVRVDAGSFVKLDEGGDVGRLLGPAGVEGAVLDGVGVDLAAAADLPPLHVPAEAAGAEAAGVEEE